MKESNINADIATIKHLQIQILLNTKEQYMKESSMHVVNAIMKQLQREVLLSTRGQYMKESNTLAYSVGNN